MVVEPTTHHQPPSLGGHMQEIRLVDPNGYTVPDTIHTVSDGTADAVRQHLLDDIAPKDAAYWTGLGFTADARDYRIA